MIIQVVRFLIKNEVCILLSIALIPFIIRRQAQFFKLVPFVVLISHWWLIFLVIAIVIQEYKGVDEVTLAQVPMLDPRGHRDAQHDASRQEPNQAATVLL